MVPAFDAPNVGLAGNEVAPSPFSVDLVAMVPLPPAPTHTVRFDDETPEPQLGESELRVEESPTTRLIASHRGPDGNEIETRFLFRGPKFSALEDRSITFVFTAATPAAGAGAHATPALALVRAAGGARRRDRRVVVATTAGAFERSEGRPAAKASGGRTGRRSTAARP